MAQLPGFVRKFLSRFGLKKDEEGSSRRGNEDENGPSVKRPTRIRATTTGPVVSQCTYGDGGVQGLKWYSEKLCIDEDGDVAQEFFVISETSGSIPLNMPLQTDIEVHTKPVKLKGTPICSFDGNVHQFVEAFGEVYWA
ncbi:hypothetical protein O6H91_24G003900 [Diphasiastrum complanatum]|uniref:Uncharacterized protein n=1 Tax=Diphasiastrum complanatum TaxID=34168 RepID=A0ACC2A7D2_DIPCM|nr:hypothetical protein O6H91_24G003900 [Diphasiastrum complanatum]